MGPWKKKGSAKDGLHADLKFRKAYKESWYISSSTCGLVNVRKHGRFMLFMHLPNLSTILIQTTQHPTWIGWSCMHTYSFIKRILIFISFYEKSHCNSWASKRCLHSFFPSPFIAEERNANFQENVPEKTSSAFKRCSKQVIATQWSSSFFSTRHNVIGRGIRVSRSTFAAELSDHVEGSCTITPLQCNPEKWRHCTPCPFEVAL